MYKIKQTWADREYLLIYNKESSMRKKATVKKTTVKKVKLVTFMDKVVNGTYNFFASPWDK
tara:strand:+ start:194 stop:376 length:183 start_codon:yes stop_codon:yes gene_type:complete